MQNKTFIKGITLIKELYKDFEFDFKNEKKINLWMMLLNSIPDEEFIKVIMAYSEKNKYAPHTPRHLLEVYEEVYTPKVLSPSDAWEKMLEVARSCGHFRSKGWLVLETLQKDYPLICATADHYFQRLCTLRTDDYELKKEWMTYYSERVKEFVKPNVLITAKKNERTRDYELFATPRDNAGLLENKEVKQIE